MKRKLMFLLAILLVLILFVSNLGGGNAGAAKQVAGGARWEASIKLHPEAARLALQDRGTWVEDLRMDGVSAGITNDWLTMSGQKDMDQLGAALFDTASPWMDFLGGGVDLTIYMPSDGNTLTLNFEARNTTGYIWEVVGGDYIQDAEAAFTMRYRGMGAPSIQNVRLLPSRSGDTTIRLAYRRPWEDQLDTRAMVSIWMDNPVAGISLSDPTPNTIADESTRDEENNSAYASLDDIRTALPPSWDWRTKGIVPAVRDQAGCGSCWAFGTVGVMESAILKAGGPLTNLSEQFLISCNRDGWSCNGGLTATKYHFNTLGRNQSVAGAVMELAKPYRAVNGTCPVAYKHPYKASNWKFITGSEWTMPTNTQLKTAIYTYGPVTAGVCADNGWNTYSGGVYVPSINACGGGTNHQIVLVGWDDATSSWILRNSWGPSWGEAGYMRIRWDATGLKSRVGEGTSWVRYINPAIPILVSPTGTITDTTPTFNWKKVSGATQYRYQVYQGPNLLYTKMAGSAACGTTDCTSTPLTTLTPATHKWRAQAYIGGVWKTYSAYRYFTVTSADEDGTQSSGTSNSWSLLPGVWSNNQFIINQSEEMNRTP